MLFIAWLLSLEVGRQSQEEGMVPELAKSTFSFVLNNGAVQRVNLKRNAMSLKSPEIILDTYFRCVTFF